MRSICAVLFVLICIPLAGHAEEGDMLSKVSREFCNALVAADAGKIRGQNRGDGGALSSCFSGS